MERSPFISKEDYDNADLPNYVHDNAREVAMQIFNHFVRGTRIVVLRAQMQCGKTSVVRHLCYLLNVCEYYRALGLSSNDRVYVLNNISDNALRDQTRERLKGVMIYSDLNVNHAVSRMYSPANLSSVLETIKQDRLLISDESHYGTTRGGVVDQIMATTNSRLAGDIPAMRDNNTYLLLVSATPFAEIGLESVSDNISNGLVAPKAIVTLKPAYGYYGLADMLATDKIINSADEAFFDMDRVLKLTQAEFFDEMELFLTHYELEKGFVFLRANGSKADHVKWCTMLQDCIGDTDNRAWFEWNMETSQDHTDVLDAYAQSLPDEHYESAFGECKRHAGIHDLKGIDAVVATNPGIPVFVFIKGFLKAGKTIDTTNVCSVIDLPTDSNEVASLVQGLVGRCCGYRKNKNLLVFTSEQCVRSYVEWVTGVLPESRVKATKHATIDTDGVVHTLSRSAYYRK